MKKELSEKEKETIEEAISQRDSAIRQFEKAKANKEKTVERLVGRVQAIRDLNDLPDDAELMAEDDGDFYFEYEEQDDAEEGEGE